MMVPDISEFSYGFALTHELVGRLGPLRAAPVFPSLIEEGRAGGGYDVHLNAPGVMMFLQFKRADCMVRGNALEIQRGLALGVPFYRMKITERRRSAQHDLLLELDQGANEVFYAAPRFHSLAELNHAWQAGTVEDRSFFIRPRDIGYLDDDVHHVAFDENGHFVCSEPRSVKAIIGRELDEVLLNRLRLDRRPLREGPIAEALQNAEMAVLRARERQVETPSSDDVRWRAVSMLESEIEDSPTESPPRLRASRPVPLRAPREARTEEEAQLRHLADLSLRVFGTQLVVMQDQRS